MHHQEHSGVLQRLQQQLRYVCSNVPCYGRFRPDNHSVLELLSSLPIVDKSIIRQRYADFISNDFTNIRAQLVETLIAPEAPDRMIYEAVDRSGVLIGQTGGSTGTPFRCPKGVADRMRLGVGIWRQRAMIDASAEPGQLYPFLHHGARTTRFDPDSNDPAHLRALYEHVAATQCRWLHATAPMLLRHLDILQGVKWRPSLPALRFLECSSYFMKETTIDKLEDTFMAKVVDQYGLMETSVIALTCEHGVHHLNDYNTYVEILDDEDRPAPVGVAGRIVVTSLQQRLLPFVRYVTGDYGMFIEKTCSCKLGAATIRLLEGRESEFVAGGTQRVSGKVLFQHGISKALMSLGNCNLKYVRIIQTGVDEFVLRTNSLSEPDQFCAFLQRYTSSELGRTVCFRHDTLDDEHIIVEDRGKSWLFRKEMV
jgi:phenylacetate-CoA ligase